MFTRLSVGAALFVAACSIPDPDQVPLRCDSANPCPEGRQCQADGMCSPAAASMADLGVATDMTGASVDMSERPGCAGPDGTRLGPGTYKCPGAFGGTNPKASALCAQGYAPCDKIDAAALAACNAGPSFFASAIIGSRRDFTPPGTGQCDQRELFPVVYGCGSSGRVASMACSGFDHLIDCNEQLSFWTCGTSLDATTSKQKNNGVLCCLTQ